MFVFNVVVLPDPFRGMWAWRNSTETHQSGHTPRSGSEVKDGSSAFQFWPLVQTLGRGMIVWSPWSFSMTPSLGRGRVAPQHWKQTWRENVFSTSLVGCYGTGRQWRKIEK